MFNKLVEKVREYFRLTKKIKKFDELLALRTKSFNKHQKRSITEYKETGIPVLKLNREILIEKRQKLFKKQKPVNPIILRTGETSVVITDVGVTKGRKVRKDKGTKRVTQAEKLDTLVKAVEETKPITPKKPKIVAYVKTEKALKDLKKFAKTTKKVAPKKKK
jgi:hypothetical protein